MIGPYNVLTMILAGGKGERLSPLTETRSKPAVPFGGSFKIIDFTLMNCVMSGIRRINILTQYHAQSMTTHLQERWSFLSGELGDYIDTLPPKLRSANGVYQGTADAIYHNLDLLEANRPDYVLILSGDHVYRADYASMVRRHIESKADVTVLCGECSTEEASSFGVVEFDSKDQIRSFVEKPADPSPYQKDGKCQINLGVYCFSTKFLVKRLVADAKRGDSAHDFGKNILPESVELGRVVSCSFKDISPGKPYWRDVGTLDSYYQCHMDLLAAEPSFDLLDPRWSIDSRFRDFMPARIANRGDDRQKWSLISSGVEIGTSKIISSVISPRVMIGDGSKVESSIIFSGVKVGENVKIRNAIIDEGVIIPDGTTVGHGNDADFEHTDNGLVVIPRGFRFPGQELYESIEVYTNYDSFELTSEENIPTDPGSRITEEELVTSDTV